MGMIRFFAPFLLVGSMWAQVAGVALPRSGEGGGVTAGVGGSTLQLNADSDRTMSAGECAGERLRVTSSVPLTATRKVVAPVAAGRRLVIENATSGGQSILVVDSGGVGVTIANGGAAAVSSDGTNLVAAAAAAVAVPGDAGGSGLTSFMGRTDPAAILMAADVTAAITNGGSQYLGSVMPSAPGGNNVTLGVGAAPSLITNAGTGVGGDANVVIGHNAGHAMTTAREDVLVGYGAGANITGNGSGPDDMIFTIVGSQAGGALTNAGGAGVIIGQKAGGYMTSSAGDVIVGTHAATSVLTSSYNTFLGQNVLDGGSGAVNGVVTTSVFLGNGAAYQPSSTAQSLARMIGVGHNTFGSLTTTSDDIAIGDSSCTALTTGTFNIAIGSFTQCGTTGNNNVAVGSVEGFYLTTGSYNMLMNSGAHVSTGSYNLIEGEYAGTPLSTGSGNTMLGVAAGQNAGDISGAVLIGVGAGKSAKANNAVAVGAYAGQLATGSANTFLGNSAGDQVGGGSNDTALGDNALSLLGGNESNDTGVGAYAQIAGGVSNATQIGPGINGIPNSFQVMNTQILDGNTDLHSAFNTPSPAQACTPGALRMDSNYLYGCSGGNTFKRVAWTAAAGASSAKATAGGAGTSLAESTAEVRSGVTAASATQACASGGYTASSVGAVAEHSDSWYIASLPGYNGGFAVGTVLGQVYYDAAGSMLQSVTARVSYAADTNCSVAPTIAILDLGASAATDYANAVVLTTLPTETFSSGQPGASANVFTVSGLSVGVPAGHYLGLGFSAGACSVDPPTFSVTTTHQ